MLNSVYCHNCRVFLRVPGSVYCTLHNDKSTSLRKNYVPIIEGPVDIDAVVQYTRDMDKNKLIELIETKIEEYRETLEPHDRWEDPEVNNSHEDWVYGVLQGLEHVLDIVKDQP